jgi:oxygen-dependent protoporphyrinogen oxidase
MASLPLRLAERMADAVEFDSNRSAEVVSRILASAGGDAVVLATSAYSAAELLSASCGRVAELLAGIAYAPLAVIAMAFDQQQVGRPLDGFGFLVPRREGLAILGTVWNSALFPHRAPPGKVLITSFIGGATDLGVTSLSEGQLLDIAVRENSRLLEISGPPLHSAVFRYACALPQYSLGHAERLSNLAGELDRVPGLFLTGNYWAGPSIGDCLEHAFATAERVNAFLRSEGK